MIWWVPVAYVCMLNSDCVFTYGKVEATEDDCMKILIEARNTYEAHPGVRTYDGVCLPVTSGKSA